MINYINMRSDYWNDNTCEIIFHPVSVSKNIAGQSIFNKNIRRMYYEVYDEYCDYMIGESKKKLLGDIQLVRIGEKKLILNAFVYYDDRLNLKALSKTLIELSNLIEEYKLSAALPHYFSSKDYTEYEDIDKIIEAIFEDCKSEVYIYDLCKKKHR